MLQPMMKLCFVSIALLFLAPPIARAQDAAPAAVDLEARPSPADIPDETTPSPAAPQLPDLSKLDEAFKRTSIGQAGDENRQRIEIQLLRNRFTNDADIKTAKQNAEAARTDVEKREGLRNYYHVLYGRMRRSASSEGTRKALDQEEASHLAALDQP